MAALVIRDIPETLHQRLRVVAQRHHRSMNREVLAILEQELDGKGSAMDSEPAVPSRPVSAAWVRETTRALREIR